MVTADELLAGPRGRLLCWAVLQAGLADDLRDLPAWLRAWEGVNAGDLSGRVDALASIVARADLASLAASSGTVLEALGWTVDAAGYWGEPGQEDQALASDAAAAALRPVAAALATSPATGWWDSPVDLARQRYVQYLDNRPFDEPVLAGAADRVAAWVTDIVRREESLRGEPEEPLGAWSGHWWSHPAMSGLPVTTRALPGLGAARLVLVEDGLGWKLARCWPLRPRDGARIYEIDGPAAWASLVARFPLEVTRSRRHDWWRATGQSGRWLIPDYRAVAGEYDAVHVSVVGYLTAAGVAVPVPGYSAGARELSAREPSGREPSAREPSGREPSGREPSGREPSAREPSGREPSGREPSGREPSGREPSARDTASAGGEARTLLAGWDPDATWWLTDALSPDGPPEDWAADDDGGPGWRPVGKSPNGSFLPEREPPACGW